MFGLGSDFSIVTEYFCVAIEFVQGQEFLCRYRVFLCCDRVWPWARILCCDKVFLCCDRVGQGEEKLCHDKVFFVSR